MKYEKTPKIGWKGTLEENLKWDVDRSFFQIEYGKILFFGGGEIWDHMFEIT